MNKVQDSCTGPRFPRIPRFFGTLSGSCLIVPKKSWDSWESWACAGLVSFLHLWSHQTCTGPRFPRIPMNKVQDSCTGPRFPRIPRFLGGNPRILGFLGILGLRRFFNFKDGESSPNLHRQVYPRILMNKVQDSCTGPRFPRIPRLRRFFNFKDGESSPNLHRQVLESQDF